jgi:hypothetical protein
MQKIHAATLLRELRELQQKRYRLFAEYRAARRQWIPAPDATRTVSKRKRKAAPAAGLPVRPPKPTVTVKPAVKSAKVRRGI